MSASSHTGSAKIYEFPVRGRFAAGGGGEATKADASVASLRLPKTVAVIDGWYHEAAVKEAERAVKR